VRADLNGPLIPVTIALMANGKAAVKRLVLIMGTAAVLATASGAAQAEPVWTDGTLEYDVGFSCSSIIFNNPRLVQMTGAGAGFLADRDDVPRIGEVFYTRLTTALVGDPCGGGAAVLPEWVPPAGVEVAIDAKHPVLWRYADTPDRTFFDTDTVASPGQFDGVVIAAATKDHPEGQPWPLAISGPPLEIRVPVRSTRVLNGIGSVSPECDNRRNGAAPCQPKLSGDHLQIAVNVADGGDRLFVIPYVGLFAAKASELILPRSVTSRQLARGVKVTLTNLVPGTAIALQLRSRASRLGSAHATATKRGNITLTLRPSPPARRPPASLTVRAVISAKGKDPVTLQRTLRVRR
jgi:hypothetical protein